jgi:hypothetical protein
MFRSLSRLLAELIAFIGAITELTLFASLLPGDSFNTPVAGVLVTMILVAGVTVILAGPFWLVGRVRT